MVYLAGVSGAHRTPVELQQCATFSMTTRTYVFQILPGGVTFDDGCAAAPRVLDSSATAVLAFNDLLATGLMGALSDQGVEVQNKSRWWDSTTSRSLAT